MTRLIYYFQNSYPPAQLMDVDQLCFRTTLAFSLFKFECKGNAKIVGSPIWLHNQFLRRFALLPAFAILSPFPSSYD